MSAAEFRNLPKPSKGGRYKRSPKEARTVGGIVFDSSLEAQRWIVLGLLERAGKISNLQRQQAYLIEIRGMPFCKFTPDFEYITSEGLQVIEEVKSSGTAKEPDYKLRKLAFELYYGLKVTEIISR